MQIYYFYHHPDDNTIFVSQQKHENCVLNFMWIDSLRTEVVGRIEHWQKDVFEHTHIIINELHTSDILNIEHPCGFDVMEEYDFLIFRKLVTPHDHIGSNDTGSEQHQSEFGLITTPVNFIIAPKALVTVREDGNKAIQNYIERLVGLIGKRPNEQNKQRKLPVTSINLTLRILNSMIDDYLGLRAPLTRRVEYWQKELLQGKHYFHQWQQLLEENMAFQQVENLCEEQIETLQELRDETVENYHHLSQDSHFESLDLVLVRINDLASHIERIQKHTARLRSSIQAAIDLHFSAISNQTNENMRILAIITAVFAPLTLLTGIYGMNFEFIPGLKSPQGFWMMLVAMLLCTVLLIYYFYRRHLVGRSEKSVLDLLSQSHEQKGTNFLSLLDMDPIKQKIKEVEQFAKRK